MNPPMHHQSVEGEEGSTYIDPQLTMRHPTFPGDGYDDGMPLRHRYHPSAPPSQVSVGSSLPCTHSLEATSFTTPNDPPQESGSSSPALRTADTRVGGVDVMKGVKAAVEAAGSWNDSMPDFPSTLEIPDLDEEDSGNPLLPLSQSDIVPLVIPTDTDKLRNLIQAAVEIRQTLILMSSGMTECPREQLLRTQQQLHEINEHISSMLPQPAPTGTVVSANDTQVPDASNGSKRSFKCRDCGDKARPLSNTTIKRHVHNVHYPESTWHCHQCDFVAPRRHRLNEHIRMIHNRSPTDEELDKQKRDHDCPPICPLCGCTVKDWKDFYRCFISHCTIGGPPPSNACSSRRPSVPSTEETDDDADDDQNPPTPAMKDPRPTQWQDGLRNPMQLLLPGSHANPNQLMGDQPAVSNQSLRPQPSPNNQSRQMAPPPPPRATGSGVPGNGRHPIPGDARRRNPQRPRTPLDSILDRRHRIERPPRRIHNCLECDRCGHSFWNCRFCHRRTDSAGGCHACDPGWRIGASTQAPSRRDASGPTSAPRMPNLEDATQNLLGRRDLVFDPNAPYAPGQGFGWGGQGYYYTQGNLFDDFDQMMADTTGGLWTPPRRNHPQVRAVLSLEEAVLTEEEMEYSSGLALKNPRPLGVLTSILPLIDPFKKWLFTPFKSLSTMALSGLDLITETEELPPADINSDPETECQCKCRCRTRTELGPGRHMEMSLELSPADDSGTTTTNESNSHHLRARVQIVVKLLRLRSSVTTSNRTEDTKHVLEQAFAPTLGEMVPGNPGNDSEDSETSDTESVFSEDELSISSSCSDLQALSLGPDNPPTDEVVDVLDLIKEKGRREEDVTVKFDFDLQSALGKLSKWSGGSSESICSDLSTSDPSRVLEYLAAYVLYVVMALARSGEHASGPRLSQ